MRVSPTAGRGHLRGGACLTPIALACAFASIAFDAPIVAFGVFFFGVWGGMEVGRYLERWLETRRGPGGRVQAFAERSRSAAPGS
jgi:hypothetical protein